MSDDELYEAGRGSWVLGERADREHYALITFDGVVRMAIEIDRLVTTDVRDPSDTRDHRRAIEGLYDLEGLPVTPISTRRRPLAASAIRSRTSTPRSADGCADAAAARR